MPNALIPRRVLSDLPVNTLSKRLSFVPNVRRFCAVSLQKYTACTEKPKQEFVGVSTPQRSKRKRDRAAVAEVDFAENGDEGNEGGQEEVNQEEQDDSDEDLDDEEDDKNDEHEDDEEGDEVHGVEEDDEYEEDNDDEENYGNAEDEADDDHLVEERHPPKRLRASQSRNGDQQKATARKIAREMSYVSHYSLSFFVFRYSTLIPRYP